MAHPLNVSASRKGAFLSSCVLASTKRRPALVKPGFCTRSIIESISAGADTDLVENAALKIIDQCMTGTGDHHALIGDIRRIALSVQKSDSIDTPIHDCSLSTIDWLTEQHLSAPVLPPRGYTPTEPLISWISKWFENKASIKVVDRLDADIGLRRSWLIKNLDDLRDHGPSLWQLIVSGQFSEALRQNAKNAILSIEDMRELVRQQALFFYYVDVVLKGHLIRRWNTAPLGDTMPVDCDWPIMASVMESQIIVPAQQISAAMAGLYTNIYQRPGATTSPLSEVPNWLRDPRLVAVAERVQSRLIGGRNRSSSFAKVAASLVAELSSVTALNRSTLSKHGLGRREFVMERIGLTGSESSVILAMALLNAKARIDICIDAALSNEAVSGHFELNYHAVEYWNGAVCAEKSKISSRALVRTSMFLRRHLAMDRHHAERSCGYENTNAGRAMVDAVRKKFWCVHPGDAITVLVHDPAI